MPGSSGVIASTVQTSTEDILENETGETSTIEVTVDETLPPEKQIAKLKRFLKAVKQLALPDQESTVQNLILQLAVSELEPGEFFKELQGAMKFPLRPYVIPFLYSSLPLLRKECENMNEADLKLSIFESGSPQAKFRPTTAIVGTRKRKLSCDKQPTIVVEPPEKRSSLNQHWQRNSNNTSRAPELKWITSTSSSSSTGDSLLMNGIPKTVGSVRPSLNVPDTTGSNNNYLDPWAWYTEEWRHIENLFTSVVTTMERLRYSMILFQQKSRLSQVWTQQQQQQRDSTIKLEEVQRKADVTVQEVKRTAVMELQKAVQVAERRALESVASERQKWQLILHETQRQDDSTESCWNCGRKAGQTCSGCGVARYCGLFCQHRDWDKHRSTCRSQGSPLNVKVEQPSPSVTSQPFPPPKSV